MFSAYISVFIFFYICFVCWHWYNMIDIIGLSFYYILWAMFVSYTFTVFDVMFRGRCLWVQWILVYNLCLCFWLFYLHMCIIFLSGICFTGRFRALFCLIVSLGSMSFLWLNVSVIDNFTSVTDVDAVYFITLSLKKLYCFDSTSLH